MRQGTGARLILVCFFRGAWLRGPPRLRKDGEPISSFLRRGEYFGPGPKAIQLIPEPELQEDYAEQQPGSP